jgi:glycosyltransferase involved in cell wall biosynthesis
MSPERISNEDQNMKVLFTNNYPMDKALEEWRRGEYPGHHLWGITHLPEFGIDVDILPYEQYTVLNKIGKILKLGNYLDQQVRVFLRSSKYDLVYSACQDNTLFLSILRGIGIFRKPIAAVIHHPMDKSRRNDMYVKGHDRLLCLSKSVLRELENEFNIGKEKTCVLDWGVDLAFYDKGKNISTLKSENSFIVSAGKSSRDYNTLAKAFFEIDYPLKIYCSARSAPSLSDLPSNISVKYNHPTFNAISYSELLPEYNKAYAVAIPLIETDSMAGLTSLLDAMAMQKAVIMTKNYRIDLDIEKEGIGIWVDPGDVRGWHHAVTYLLAHPGEANQMGNRGYHLCKSKYNLEKFSSKLASIFKSYLEDGLRRR